jgi:hypothetical protein
MTSPGSDVRLARTQRAKEAEQRAPTGTAAAGRGASDLLSHLLAMMGGRLGYAQGGFPMYVTIPLTTYLSTTICGGAVEKVDYLNDDRPVIGGATGQVVHQILVYLPEHLPTDRPGFVAVEVRRPPRRRARRPHTPRQPPRRRLAIHRPHQERVRPRARGRHLQSRGRPSHQRRPPSDRHVHRRTHGVTHVMRSREPLSQQPVMTSCALEANLQPHRQAIITALSESRRWSLVVPGEWGCCGPTPVHVTLAEGRLDTYASHADRCQATKVERPADEQWMHEKLVDKAPVPIYRPDPSRPPVDTSAALEVDLHPYVLDIADALTANAEWGLVVSGQWGCCGPSDPHVEFTTAGDLNLYSNHDARCGAYGIDRPNEDWLDQRIDEADQDQDAYRGWTPQ